MLLPYAWTARPQPPQPWGTATLPSQAHKTGWGAPGEQSWDQTTHNTRFKPQFWGGSGKVAKSRGISISLQHLSLPGQIKFNLSRVTNSSNAILPAWPGCHHNSCSYSEGHNHFCSCQQSDHSYPETDTLARAAPDPHDCRGKLHSGMGYSRRLPFSHG